MNALLGACAMGLCTSSCDCANARTASPAAFTAYTCSAQPAAAREAYGQSKIMIDSATDGQPQPCTFTQRPAARSLRGVLPHCPAAGAANTNTAAPVKFSSATRRAWFRVGVPSPMRMKHVWLKVSAPAGSFLFVALTATNRTLPLVQPGNASSAREWYHGAEYALPPNETIVAFRVEVARPLAADEHRVGWCYSGEGRCYDFRVSEIAAQPLAAVCEDVLTMDLGALARARASHVRSACAD